MAVQDPLALLRQALSTSQTIQLLSSSGDEVYDLPSSADICFPFVSPKRTFPKSTPTRYLSVPNSLDNPSAPSYDLQSLLFGYIHRDATLQDYLRQANTNKIGFISSTDRRAVIDWLSGKGAPEGPEGRIRPLFAAEGGSVGKRAEAPSSAPAGAGGDAGAGGAPPAKKQRFVPNKEDQDKVKRMMQIMEGPLFGHVIGPGEIKLEKSGGAYHNRETVLRGERANNFESVRALIGPRLKLLRDEHSRKNPSSATAPTSAPANVKAQRKKQLNPIIIISPSSTALITMHNVKQFLEESTFITSDEARKTASGTSAAGYLAEDVVQVNHARAGASLGQAAGETRKARYFVVDGVEALSKFGGAGKLDEAWDRVVCVMTTGQEWQFKTYKWKEPKELFHHVKGIYPQWANDPPNPKIKSWNVSELRIDPHKRHIDKSVVADFWRGLEGWIAANKPWLSY
ncbi:hypothetical protein JCM1841_000935 [Sporobolomyces salmonicolor]